MGFEIRKESYSGSIKLVSIGSGDSAITVGGDTCYPFYTFEGEMPNKPVIAMEIWDIEPEDWPEPAIAPFRDVLADPAAWAKKCVEKYKAEAIVLQLKSIDPNDKDASPESAAETVKSVMEAIDVPLIVWGCASPAKDEEVLKVVAEKCQNANLILGPVEEKNYKGIAAAAMGYNHSLIASSPIDVNLAKQVNILLENFGMPMDRVLVDPTTGGLGYGMEYSYSVMERLTMAAMIQGDEKLQYPMINNLGNEVWKCKEARQTTDEAPLLGDPEKRGILMEAVGAVAYLLSGSNILIMRHPESIRLTKSFIDTLADGGTLNGIDPIQKILAESDIDFAKLAPAPDLTIEEEIKKSPEKKAAAKPAAKAPKAEIAKKEAKSDAKSQSKKPILKPPPIKPGRLSTTPLVSEEVSAEQQAELAAKAKAKAELKAQAEAARKVEEKKLAKESAVAEEKAKVEATKQAEKEDRIAREEEERTIRAARTSKKHSTSPIVDLAIAKATAAANQLDQNEKILEGLNRFHKRM